jgi:hypothetical protein
VSVLPELRAQIIAAAAVPPARWRPRAEWVVGAAVVLAAAAVAFVALRHSPAPVVPARTAHFRVLERPPTAADRAAAAQLDAAPRSSRPANVRDLGLRRHGRPVLLYTLRVSRPPLPAPKALTRHNVLCVQFPDVEGSGTVCWTVAEILAGDATGSVGSQVFGLAPDGVATIRMTDPDGSVHTARVRENFFTFVRPHSGPLRGGTGYSPDPRVRIDWLDASGRRVGP